MLSETQVAVLRGQFEKVAVESDEALVAFYEQNHSEIEEVADLVEKAHEAYERLATKKASEATDQAKQAEKSEKTETAVEKTEEEHRTDTANFFFVRRRFDAAAAMKVSDLSKLNSKALAKEVMEPLVEAIKALGVYGKPNHFGWEQHNAAARILRARNEALVPKLISGKVAAVNDAKEHLAKAREAWSDEFRARRLDWAKKSLAKAKDVYWNGHTLPILEQLINEACEGKKNVLSEIFLRDPSLIPSRECKRKASQLIGALDERIKKLEEAVLQVRIGPMRPGKTARDHANGVGHSTKKAERSIHDSQYRNEQKGHNPSADKHGHKSSKK